MGVHLSRQSIRLSEAERRLLTARRLDGRVGFTGVVSRFLLDLGRHHELLSGNQAERVLDARCTTDHDRQQSTSLRHSLVTELAKPDTIGFGIHFADVPFGRVHTDGGLPTWRPVDA